MALYGVANTSAAAASNAAYCDLRAGSGQRIYIREIGITLNAATASSIGLGRPASAGTTSSSTTGVALDPADSSTSTVMGTAWSAAPTAPSTYMRRFVAPATAGSGVTWYFDRGGLVVAASSTIVLFNFGGGAGSALSVYWVWEE